MNRTACTLALLLASVTACGRKAEAPAATPASPASPCGPVAKKTGVANINGLAMYHEIHGSGTPLVLLHGALTTVETSFGKILPTLACTRQVIAIEQQAHGRTADIDRPLSYEQMADDTAALLTHLGIAKADVLGYSMGGTVALGLAVRHPEKVGKLVVVSSGYSNDACPPELLKFLKNIDPNNAPWAEFWRKEFQRVAPKPQQWPAPVARIKEMVTAFQGYRPEQIRAVTSPTLIVNGDNDMRLEHTLELFRMLPKAQLAIFPGTDHYPGMVNRAEWLLAAVTPFLDTPFAGKLAAN